MKETMNKVAEAGFVHCGRCVARPCVLRFRGLRHRDCSNIGINKIEAMLRTPNCLFVRYIGTQKLVKRKEFEEHISKKLVI